MVWPAGYRMTITVNAIVDPAADGTWDGATVTNTATTTGDNAPTQNASADVTLDVETTLVPSIAKSVTPTGTIPAVPGQPVDWTVTPGNDSNQNVDTIVVQDPVTPPGDFGGYLDVTGVDITRSGRNHVDDDRVLRRRRMDHDRARSDQRCRRRPRHLHRHLRPRGHR